MAKKRSSHVHVTLTPEQEEILDWAWDTITDAEIAESIRWLNTLPSPKRPKEQADGRQPQ